MTKPIRVWLTPPGLNPYKVVVLLEELQIPYEIVNFRFEEVKQKPFIDINPNGRVPGIETPVDLCEAIEDHNHDLVLWESGAINTYVVEQYDTEKHLTYEGLEDRHHINQWIHFQMSGQGPYFGQLSWFKLLHPEKLPSAIDRYEAEIKRVFSVLDRSLQDKQWLLGDKMTFADLAFLPWNSLLDVLLGCPYEEIFEGFPNLREWHQRLVALPSWQRTLEKREKCMEEQNLGINGQPKDSKQSLSEYANQHNDPKSK